MGVLRKRSDLWCDLASAVRIPKEQLEVISSHCQSDLDSLVEVCDVWLKDGTTLTWQEVISVLDEIDAKELAEELKDDKDVLAKSK